MHPLLLRFVLAAVVVGLAALAGRIWQRLDGRVTTASGAREDLRAGLGLPTDHDGPQGVLFGSATCAPCDTVKALLRDLETERPDLRWQYVDAVEQLELAEAHRVRRVPTLLVLDADGAEIARTSGVPSAADLRAALPAASPTPTAA